VNCLHRFGAALLLGPLATATVATAQEAPALLQITIETIEPGSKPADASLAGSPELWRR
jgi:hypothetical protein